MADTVEKLEAQLNSCTDVNERLELLHNLCFALLDIPDYSRSRKFARESLELAEDIGNSEAQGHALYLLGYNAKWQGDFADALAYYSQARSCFERVGSQARVVDCLTSMGSVYKRLTCYEKSLELYLEALGLWQEMGDKRGIATSYNNIGLWYKVREDYDKALEYLFKALDMFERADNMKYAAYAMQNIGAIEIHRRNYQEARRFLDKALKLSNTLDMGSLTPGILRNIAECHFRMGDSEAAMDYGSRALAMARSTGNKSDSVTSLQIVAEIHNKDGQYDAAVDHLKEARAIVREQNAKDEELDVCRLMIETYEAMGDYPKALECSNERFDLAHGLFKDTLKTINDAVTKLQEITIAKERIESELKVAHDIQMSIVPKIFPDFVNRPEFDMYPILAPAKEVGGDLYDFFFIDNDHLCFVIGDVSGKGVPASLFMAVTQTLIKSTAGEVDCPAGIMERVNKELVRDNDSCMFVTVFCGILNIRTGEVRYANAGHNPPLIIRKNGGVEYLPIGQNCAVGVNESATFLPETLVLQPEDSIYMYTDGVTEALSKEGKKSEAKRS